MRVTICARLALGLAVSVAMLAASTCAPEVMGPTCATIGQFPIVFVGTVKATEPDPLLVRKTHAKVYRFQVETIYKGLEPGTTEVVINPFNGSGNTMRFRLGGRYLVFANRDKGSGLLFSGTCHGSKLVEYATEDLRFLEEYRRGHLGNSVFGKVLQTTGWLPGRPYVDVPFEGATVMLRSESRTFTQQTSDTGQFRFEDLPPGSYSLSAEREPYAAWREAARFELPAVGCVEQLLALRALSSISGTLMMADGTPATDTKVEVMRRTKEGEWLWASEFWKTTNSAGEFKFEELPDGDYLLGYEIRGGKPDHLSMFPTRYYPGTPDRERATVLHLVPRQSLRGLRFSMGKADTERTIRVEVVWPGGKRPKRNVMQLLDGKEPIKYTGGAAPGETRELHHGVIEFTGYAEREYELIVRCWIDDEHSLRFFNERRIARSEPVHVKPGTNPVKVRLVLTKTLLAGDENWAEF